MTANNDKNRTYSVYYTPKVTGMHKVRLQGQQEPHKRQTLLTGLLTSSSV